MGLKRSRWTGRDLRVHKPQPTIFAILYVLHALLLAPAIVQASEQSNLLTNGSFALTNPTGSPEWRGPEQTVALRPEWARLLIRGSLRVTKMDSDKAATQAGACVDLAWRMMTTGQRVHASSPTWQNPTGGWVEINQLLDIPKGADQLIVTPQIARAAGSADFRDLSVVAWVTTFDDEFGGDALDTSRWTPTDTNQIEFAPGIQYFSPDHVIVKDGMARFHADNKPQNGRQYQSGEIRSVAKFQQLYGFWEFRVKIPYSIAMWPAAYLLKWDDGWPPEVDIMESSVAWGPRVVETNHFANDYGKHGDSHVNFPSDGIDREAWHTYAICWEPGAMAWYFDNIYRGTTQEPDARIPDVPMYIRMNLAITSWEGDPSTASWPKNMDCDYVRIYQRSDLSLPLHLEPSQEITLPTKSVTLSAISCNPMTLAKAKWSLLDGPGGATIQNPNALTTKATFSRPGMYRFNLTVAEGASCASRDLLVFVNPEPQHS